MTALLLWIGAPVALAFHVHRPLALPPRTLSHRCMSEEDTQSLDPQFVSEEEQVNGASLVLQNDERSSLASAFSNLKESDQYDAVLTGLCAKILDDTSEEKAISSLQDPVSLIQEMNQRNVEASGRSLMAFIDVRVLMFVMVSASAPMPFTSPISFFFSFCLGYSQDTGCSRHDKYMFSVFKKWRHDTIRFLSKYNYTHAQCRNLRRALSRWFS
jgi:hypothetical protein